MNIFLLLNTVLLINIILYSLTLEYVIIHGYSISRTKEEYLMYYSYIFLALNHRVSLVKLVDQI
ncbi:hypothetical protein DRN87_01830 [Candidatus Geothermarchaeota archaeon]|nr:MAG: hypothetical protein DRN87_01830 [Candidatus Geothermarchaeota archaeon]